jgi:catechol 2,3-dioxygenase-like lactoylglutathione lyase family enzyme
MQISRLDHLVLTVADIESSAGFYTRVLGMEEQVFEGGRRAVKFGPSKINLHQAGHEFEPKALRPVPGSADICLIAVEPLGQIIAELASHGVEIEEGAVEQTRAMGPIISVYFHDPDQNLIEVSNYR